MRVALLALVATLAACADDEYIPRRQIDAAVIDAPMGAVDAAVDAADPCAACTTSQICVQRFGGACADMGTRCEERVGGCTGTSCTAQCDLGHCLDQGDAGVAYTCSAGPCAGENPAALHCYGP